MTRQGATWIGVWIGAFHESFRRFEIVYPFRAHLRCRRAIFSARANNTRQGRRQENLFVCKNLEEGSKKTGEERRDDGRHFFGVEVPSPWAGGGFGARDVDCGESKE